jgi:hypothetical protein
VYLGHQIHAEPQKRPRRERLAIGALHGDSERQLRVVNRDAPRLERDSCRSAVLDATANLGRTARAGMS